MTGGCGMRANILTAPGATAGWRVARFALCLCAAGLIAASARQGPAQTTHGGNRQGMARKSNNNDAFTDRHSRAGADDRSDFERFNAARERRGFDRLDWDLPDRRFGGAGATGGLENPQDWSTGRWAADSDTHERFGDFAPQTPLGETDRRVGSLDRDVFGGGRFGDLGRAQRSMDGPAAAHFGSRGFGPSATGRSGMDARYRGGIRRSGENPWGLTGSFGPGIGFGGSISGGSSLGRSGRAGIGSSGIGSNSGFGDGGMGGPGLSRSGFGSGRAGGTEGPFGRRDLFSPR